MTTDTRDWGVAVLQAIAVGAFIAAVIWWWGS